MPRPKFTQQPPLVLDPELDQARIDTATAQMRMDAHELVLIKSQHDSAVRAVAAQLGYQLPADCTDPDLIQRDISANMRRSVEACLQVGMGLKVLKEACNHGEFIARLDVLGIEPRVAQKFMQSASKFGNAPLTAHLTKAIGNQTKLFEMLILDEDQTSELLLTGQTGDLRLDEIDSMSVKELRHKLREEREEAKARNQVLADKNATIDNLHAKVKRVQVAPPDESFSELQKEATGHMNDALGAVRGKVRASLNALKDHPISTAAKDVFMASLVGTIQAELTALRNEFGLPDVSTAADQALAADVAEWSQD